MIHPRTETISVKDPRFGARGNGVVDDTAAIQRALDYLHVDLGIGGGELVFPPGEYLISNTLEITRQSIHVRGFGWTNAPTYANRAHIGQGTTLRWAPGSGAKPMVKVRDSRGVVFEGVKFQGASQSANPEDTPTAAINFHMVSGDNKGSNAKLHVDRCYIGPFDWTDEADDHAVAVGVLLDGVNANNDEWTISRSVIAGCTEAGVKVANSQSTWARIIDTLINDCPVGVYTAADLGADNLHFNRCGRDWEIIGGTSVWATRYMAENSGQLALLGVGAKFVVHGGDVNMNALTTYAIDCPDTRGARIILRDLDFDLTWDPAFPIRMASNVAATNRDGTLFMENCSGAGFAPETHLEVDPAGSGHVRYVWYIGRSADECFRNVLRSDNGDTLDVSRFDTGAASVESPGGVVVHSPDGSRWRITVANDGTLSAVAP